MIFESGTAMWTVYYVLMGVIVQFHAYALIKVLYAHPYSNEIIRFHLRWVPMKWQFVESLRFQLLQLRFFYITHGFNKIAFWLFWMLWFLFGMDVIMLLTPVDCHHIKAGHWIFIRSSSFAEVNFVFRFWKKKLDCRKCWLRRKNVLL